MIKFFRKIRQDLLSKGKTGKYLKYAIGEIVLVVIGILIALQINSWNEFRKTRIEEKESLAMIKRNLETEIAFLDNRVFRNDKVISYLTDVYEKKWDHIPLDSLGIIGTTFFYYQPVNSGYQGLKSNSKLSIILDNELREKIIYYYENKTSDLMDWSVWHRNFVINYFEPFVFTHLPLNPKEEIYDIAFLKEQLETVELNSIISNQIGSLSRVNTTIAEAKTYAIEIVDMIEDRID